MIAPATMAPCPYTDPVPVGLTALQIAVLIDAAYRRRDCEAVSRGITGEEIPDDLAVQATLVLKLAQMGGCPAWASAENTLETRRRHYVWLICKACGHRTRTTARLGVCHSCGHGGPPAAP